MENGFMMEIARIGVRVGMRLTGQQPDLPQELDRPALANAIFRSAVEQTCDIVSKLGIARQINLQRGEFGLIVGIIAGRSFELAEFVGSMKLSIADCTLDLGDTCMRAHTALLR